MKRQGVERVEIKREDLERLLERARPALTAGEYRELKAALDTLLLLTQLLEHKNTTLARLRQILFGASTEKTAAVLKSLLPGATSGQAATAGAPATTSEQQAPRCPGHGRNGVPDYPGALTVAVPHPELAAGQACPECHRGKLYELAPTTLLRITGQPPLAATVYELQKLRCNLCLAVFTAPAPPAVGSEKYDAGAASMIALLKYGSGVPFYRLSGLQDSLGVPLPDATQWEIVAKTATRVQPVVNELIRQAAQGEVFHQDDTGAQILSSGQEGHDAKRKGTRTSAIVSLATGRPPITLFFTGRQHAGENLAAVLAQRAQDLGPPIQMADALACNFVPTLQTIIAKCLTHARRKYVAVAPQFPAECQVVLAILAAVYQHDAHCKQQQLSAAERLRYHQEHSGPLMAQLQAWGETQFAQRKVEPNSGLGQAIKYMRKHWPALTLFLRQPGAPLDNNVCEQVLKLAILHRKNAYFYKTDHGARVGDAFMSLIHTAVQADANPFAYLTALQTHAAAVAQHPARWLPWNYRDQLAPTDSS